MHSSANRNEARAPLTAGESARNLTVSAAVAGLASQLLLDAGMPVKYTPFTGPILMAVVSVIGNVWRNVRENSQLARWLG